MEDDGTVVLGVGLLDLRLLSGDRFPGDNLGDTDDFGLFGEVLSGVTEVLVFLTLVLVVSFLLLGGGDFSFSAVVG